MAYSHPKEHIISKASKQQGLKSRRPATYIKSSLDRLPPALEKYWRAKEEYNFEETNLTENDMQKIGEAAYQEAKQIIDKPLHKKILSRVTPWQKSA